MAGNHVERVNSLVLDVNRIKTTKWVTLILTPDTCQRRLVCFIELRPPVHTAIKVINGTMNMDEAGRIGGAFRESDLEKKIFVGGLTWDTTDADLQSFFGQFGEVTQVQTKYDPMTGRSRGFAFVEFTSKDSVDNVLKKRHYEIKNKEVEVKKAVSRENKKIFVGGVSADLPNEDIRQYFSQFGEVDEVELPVDKQSNRRRNFAFVIFKSEESADRASAQQKHLLGDRYCDVKKATPIRPGAPGHGNAASNYGYGYGGGRGDMAGGGQAAYSDYYQAWANYYNYYYGGYGYGGAGGQGGAATTPADWSQYASMWQQYNQQQQQYQNQNQ